MKYFSIEDEKLTKELTSVQIKVKNPADDKDMWVDIGCTKQADGSYMLALATTAEIKVTYDYTVVKPETGSDVTNTAKVKAWNDPEKLSKEEEGWTTIPYQDPAVMVSKTISHLNDEELKVTPKTVEVDRKITWTIKVTNTTEVPYVGLSLTDEMYFDDETKTVKDGEGNDVPVAADVTPDDPNVNADDFTVPGGETVTFTATYTVRPDDAGKTIKNVAVASKGSDKKEGESSVEVGEYTLWTKADDHSTIDKNGTKYAYDANEMIKVTFLAHKNVLQPVYAYHYTVSAANFSYLL